MENNSVKVDETSLESLYLKKDFAGAKDYLLKHRDMFNIGQFHYNFGTLDLKLGNYATARFHLEKALLEGQQHPKVYKNLEVATQLLQLQPADQEIGLLDQLVMKGKSIPLDAFVTIFLAIIFLLALVWARKWVVKKWILSGMAILSICPLIIYFYLHQLSIAIVLKDVTLREGPSKLYSESNHIPAGSKLILGEKNGTWFFVKSPLKFAGWVEQDNLGLL